MCGIVGYVGTTMDGRAEGVVMEGLARLEYLGYDSAGIALVEWLSAQKQQVAMWASKKQGGHFPSNSQAAAAPSVNGATSAYFSNAAVGQIFGDIAKQMKIPPIGLYDTQIQQALTTQLTNVETKGTPPDKAFADAMAARPSTPPSSSTFAAGTVTSRSSSAVATLPSAMRHSRLDRPGASAGTKNSATPSASPGLPERRADRT